MQTLFRSGKIKVLYNELGENGVKIFVKMIIDGVYNGSFHDTIGIISFLVDKVSNLRKIWDTHDLEGLSCQEIIPKLILEGKMNKNMKEISDMIFFYSIGNKLDTKRLLKFLEHDMKNY